MALDLNTLPREARELLLKFPEFEPNYFNDSGANGYVLLGRHNVNRPGFRGGSTL